MSTRHRKLFNALWLIAAAFITSASGQDTKKSKPEPLMIQEQGSFAVGGTVITAPGTFDPIKQGAYNPNHHEPAGQTFHGDHAYVFYQVPVNARKLPLVFWHGHGQFTKSWETTPDGREGFQNIFLRRRFPVYLIDQPRRGHAARSTQPITITPTTAVQPTAGKQLMGDIAPKLADLTDNVLFADVWERPGLSKRDRSLATVAALIAMNRPDQLRSHLARARDNGVTEQELIEAITHLAFYAGWPSAVTAVGVAREVFQQK